VVVLSSDARARIIEEAKKKASEILREAEKTAELILVEAEKKWRERAEAERKRILREAEVRASAIIAEAKRASSFIVGRAKAEVIEEVYRRAREVIESGKYDVEASLRNLLREALSYVKKPVKVVVRRDHVDLVRKILVELGLGDVEVEGSDNILGGVVLVSEEGTVVDNRLETRLDQSRGRLLNVIAKVLLGEG